MTEMTQKHISALWVKNYTMAHIKLRELVNTRCAINDKVIIGNDYLMIVLTGNT